MGDEDEETFESADAGSSLTYPMEAGQIRKGGYIMIKGNPCKVSDVSTSKTGKHGHTKCHFVAIDIFTGKKMEVRPSAPLPRITRRARPTPAAILTGHRAVVAHHLGPLRQEG